MEKLSGSTSVAEVLLGAGTTKLLCLSSCVGARQCGAPDRILCVVTVPSDSAMIVHHCHKIGKKSFQTFHSLRSVD